MKSKKKINICKKKLEKNRHHSINVYYTYRGSRKHSSVKIAANPPSVMSEFNTFSYCNITYLSILVKIVKQDNDRGDRKYLIWVIKNVFEFAFFT